MKIVLVSYFSHVFFLFFCLISGMYLVPISILDAKMFQSAGLLSDVTEE